MSKSSETAYWEIRHRIFHGDFPPGSQIKEEELAALCGVSRTPIRDALRRLESEMVIVRRANQRCYVRPIEGDDLDEAFSLRALLEGYAAERAAQRISDDVVEELHALNEKLADVSNQDAALWDQFTELNHRFHTLLFEAAASPRLDAIIKPVTMIRRHVPDPRADMLSALSEHREITAALENRDPFWARSAAISHVRRAYHASLK